MGLLFAKLWSLFGNEGMYDSLRNQQHLTFLFYRT